MLPKIIIVLVLCTGLLSRLQAADTEKSSPAQNSDTNPAPRIVFSEINHDFGRIEAGRTLTNIFTFTNTGKAVLEINEIQSSCGCAAADNYTRRVEPGKNGELTLVFAPGTKSGQVVRNLRVLSNDPQEPVVQLNFAAIVWKPIDFFPDVAAFGFGPDFQTNLTRVIRFKSNLEKPVKISEPVFSSPYFRTEMKTVEEGKRFELHVSVIPPVPPGSLSVPITLKTSAPEQPEITLSAYTLVQPTVVLSPPVIQLADSPLPDPAEFSIRIQSKSTNSLILSEPLITSGAEATLKLEEERPGKVYKLQVSLPAGFSVSKEGNPEVTLKSNHPLQPRIRIPVRGPALSEPGEGESQSSQKTQVNAESKAN